MSESEIFMAVIQIEDPKFQASFLDSVCQSNSGLRVRIEEKMKQFAQWQGAMDGFSGKLAERFVQISNESAEVGSGCFNDGRTQIQTLPTLPAGTKVGTYLIVRCLGVGGMGEVYLASDSRLDRHVALKVLPHRHAHTPQWIQRFEREAKSASALNHPNILTIYEIGKSENCHFIASEFVDGVTLRSVNNAELELIKKLDVAIQIAEALKAAHAAGIVHRDIKPENIMIRSDGLVKVLDFGIAKQFAPSPSGNVNSGFSFATDPGQIMGTIRYMSPEQARRMDVDSRADLFSFGVVLFELIIGMLPYGSLNETRILSSLLNDEAMHLKQLGQVHQPELESIIKKLLRKEREERYQSAKEVVVDLKHAKRLIERRHSQVDVLDSCQNQDRINESGDTGEHKENETHIEIPEVRYARSGEVNIAYQILGKGELDLVFVMGWVSHLDWFWKEPSFERFLKRLASFARLIIFDKRGTGLSDRVPYDQLPTLEQRLDDVRAVMDAAGSESAILLGVSEGGPMCSLFAATYPQKTIALVMIGSYARRLKAPDYPWGPTEEQHHAFLDDIARSWGGPVGLEARAPSQVKNKEFANWWATYLRMGASPGAALALTKMNAQIDIRPILKAIQVPTIVLHRTGDRCLKVEEGRYLAEQIPGAKFVELPGSDHLPFVGNQDELLDPIAEFLTGLKPHQKAHRILATVLCAQVITSENSGAFHESQLMGLSQAHFVREIDLFRGRPILSAPNRIVASFDGPARAIRAAMAVRDSAVRLGVDVQVGLHTGECEVDHQRIRGPAVDLAQEVANHSDKNEIFVSSTVKDLVAGSGIQFVQKTLVWLADDLPECRLFEVKT